MRRIVIISLFILASAADARGQILSNLFSPDSNTSIVKEVALNAICVMGEEYQVADSCGQRYNLDTLDYFGRYEFLAIKVKDGYVAPTSMFTPWQGDEKLDKYDGYRPVPSASKLYDSRELMWEKRPSVDTSKVCTIENINMVFVKDTLFANKGFLVDNSLGEKKGWIVWAQRKGTELSLSFNRQELSIVDSVSVYPVKQPLLDSEYEFGMFICPDYSETGLVSFDLVALVSRIDGCWKAQPIIINNRVEKVEEHTLIAVVPDLIEDQTVKAKAKKEKKTSSKNKK